MDSDFIQARIDEVKIQIANISIVITKLSANKRQSYSIDDGQSKESVTTISLTQALNNRAMLVSELQYWESLLYGPDGPTYAAPGF